MTGRPIALNVRSRPAISRSTSQSVGSGSCRLDGPSQTAVSGSVQSLVDSGSRQSSRPTQVRLCQSPALPATPIRRRALACQATVVPSRRTRTLDAQRPLGTRSHHGQHQLQQLFRFINSRLPARSSADAPAYTFGHRSLPEWLATAPYNLYGAWQPMTSTAPATTASTSRWFAPPFHFKETARLDLRADLYNVTNHTQFTVASAHIGNASFGTGLRSHMRDTRRKSAQLSARIEF